MPKKEKDGNQIIDFVVVDDDTFDEKTKVNEFLQLRVD